MAGNGQRTEPPTPRRLEKARREGQFPTSKEFVSAVQFLGFLTLLAAFGTSWFLRVLTLARQLLARAFSLQASPAALMATVQEIGRRVIAPLLLGGAALVLLVLL